MRRFLILGCFLLSLLPCASVAQDADGKKYHPTFNETFSDESRGTIKALAAYEGISEDEAEARLKNMVASAATAYKKGDDHNSIIADAPIQAQSGREKPPLLLWERIADEIINAANQAGVKVNIERVAEKELVVIVADDKYIHTIINLEQLKVPDFKINVRQGQIIVPYASMKINWAGGQKFNEKSGRCTGGFVGWYYDSSSASWYKGFLTAKHCGRSGYYDVFGESYAGPSAYSAYVSWAGRSDSQDLEIMAFSDQSNNNVAPKFWDGATKGGVVVKGSVFPATGTFVCKYGRSTGQSCGYVQYETVRNADGTFLKVSNKNATSSKPLSTSGDSGGPVYVGSLIAGIV